MTFVERYGAFIVERYREFNQRRPVAGKATLISTIATVLALLVAVAQLMVDVIGETGGHALLPTTLPSVVTEAPSTPEAAPENTPEDTPQDAPEDAPADTPEGTPVDHEEERPAPAPSLPAPLCREWIDAKHAPVLIRPCVTALPNGLAISTQVRSSTPDKPVRVSVWVWSMHHDEALLEAQQYDRTREVATLRHCRLNLTNDEITTCGPFVVTPSTGPGKYAAATSAGTEPDDYPPGWSSSSFTGTQSPAVVVSDAP